MIVVHTAPSHAQLPVRKRRQPHNHAWCITKCTTAVLRTSDVPREKLKPPKAAELLAMTVSASISELAPVNSATPPIPSFVGVLAMLPVISDPSTLTVSGQLRYGTPARYSAPACACERVNHALPPLHWSPHEQIDVQPWPRCCELGCHEGRRTHSRLQRRHRRGETSCRLSGNYPPTPKQKQRHSSRSSSSSDLVSHRQAKQRTLPHISPQGVQFLQRRPARHQTWHGWSSSDSPSPPLSSYR